MTTGKKISSTSDLLNPRLLMPIHAALHPIFSSPFDINFEKVPVQL